MSIEYKMIEIFTSEKVRYRHRPVAEAILQLVQDRQIAGRCHVSKGTDACYETGEMATQNLLELSYNLPLKIEILLPSADVATLLPLLEGILEEGVITVRDVSVVAYKANQYVIHSRLLVREVMTGNPRSVPVSTPVNQVASLLLSAPFTGVPVVDDAFHPVGIITQGDLIDRAGMPLRIGLLNLSDHGYVERILQSLADKTAEQIMTAEVVTIAADATVRDAVQTMVDNHVKRMPVVDADGKLVGMLSRLDIFRIITKGSAASDTADTHCSGIRNVRFVSDIMQRDTQTVAMDAPIEDVLKIITAENIQRVAVVDQDNRFRGLISDRLLLTTFSQTHSGIWDYLSSLIPFSEKGKQHRQFQKELRSTKASQIMETELETVTESSLIDDAVRMMTEKGIKRLPVLDEDGVYRGMISRASILKAGFCREAAK